jgi:hypothetical protein
MAKQILTDLDFNSVSRLQNLLDAVSDQEPATLAQVKAYIEGLAWKDDVQTVSTANINLAAPGAAINGVTMAASYRFLAKDQSAAAENGIYIWNGAATPATRATDASTGPELLSAVVTVSTDASTNGGTTWRQTATNITIGVTSIAWTAFNVSAPSATTATAGVARLATQSDVDTGTVTDEIVTPETLAGWSGRPRRANGTLGDGAATSFTLTHNFNTKAVHVAVYRNSGNYDEVEVEVRRNNVNSVDVLFASAPTTNQYAYVIAY